MVFALAVVFVGPAGALSVDAAYANLTATTTPEVVEVTQFFPDSMATWDYTYDTWEWNGGLVSVYCDVVIKYSVSFTGTYYYNTPYELRGRISSRLKCVWNNGINNPDYTAHYSPKVREMQAEIIDTWSLDYLGGDFDTMVGTTEYNETNPGNQTFTLYTSLRKEAGAGTGNSAPVYYQKVRLHFSLPVDQHTYNDAWYSGQPKPTITISMTTPTSFRIQESADSIPFARQNAYNLQAIADGIVSNTVAADIIEDANDNFVAEAGSLEAGQAELEGAADASLEAVDYGKITMLGTYSQSVSFWGRIINALPTVTGAFWEVLVFGFLIAFLIFILRLVR